MVNGTLLRAARAGSGDAVGAVVNGALIGLRGGESGVVNGALVGHLEILGVRRDEWRGRNWTGLARRPMPA